MTGGTPWIAAHRTLTSNSEKPGYVGARAEAGAPRARAARLRAGPADPRIRPRIRDPRHPARAAADRPHGADEAGRRRDGLRLLARDQGLERPLPVEAEHRFLVAPAAPRQAVKRGST